MLTLATDLGMGAILRQLEQMDRDRLRAHTLAARIYARLCRLPEGSPILRLARVELESQPLPLLEVLCEKVYAASRPTKLAYHAPTVTTLGLTSAQT
jgi:hypothetical protein